MGGTALAFRESLHFGQMGESAIARWLRKRGHTVLPVYEKAIDTGKGPQLFLPQNGLVAPDMLVYKGQKAIWVEAKHKTGFSLHRLTGDWVTGIDLRHYLDYCEVDNQSPWPVWLLFVQRGGAAKDSPPSPPGLYGNTLAHLRAHEHHRHGAWGPSGMVYWAIGDLLQLATLDEMEN